MLTATLLLFGLVLMALALADRPVRRLPLTPALIYLAVGWAGGAAIGDRTTGALLRHAPALTVAIEFALLVSLFAVGLRLRVPPTLKAWWPALLLAGPAMVATVLMATLAAHWVLSMPWAAALLLAAIIAPTDPVLASEVQIRSEEDRDAVRVALTAEGGLNDGSALPAVMLALGLLGLGLPQDRGWAWWWSDLLWPLGGGAVLGAALGILIGNALRQRLARGDALERDELVYVGAVALAYGLALALDVSSFVVAFLVGATLLLPLRDSAESASGDALAGRLHVFGARCERLVEAAVVLALGVALNAIGPGWGEIAFALLAVFIVRPLSVLAVLHPRTMARRQRRLVAWFGIRGIGSLFYLLYALANGVSGALAEQLIGAVLTCVAVSIVLHGLSATPLMAAYHRRRSARPAAKP